MKTFEQRLACGEITIVEKGLQPVYDKLSGFRYNGEYRILSDGRRQWRQLHDDGSSSQAWDWQDCK